MISESVVCSEIRRRKLRKLSRHLRFRPSLDCCFCGCHDSPVRGRRKGVRSRKISDSCGQSQRTLIDLRMDLASQTVMNMLGKKMKQRKERLRIKRKTSEAENSSLAPRRGLGIVIERHLPLPCRFGQFSSEVMTKIGVIGLMLYSTFVAVEDEEDECVLCRVFAIVSL